MARLYLKDFDSFGTDGNHTATSWMVYKDPDDPEGSVVDISTKDKINLTEWVTPLPKRTEDREVTGPIEQYYKDMSELYARVKVHMGDSESNWLVMGPKSQKVQKVLITQEDQPDVWSDSQELKWDPSPTDDPDILTPKVIEGETI